MCFLAQNLCSRPRCNTRNDPLILAAVSRRLRNVAAIKESAFSPPPPYNPLPFACFFYSHWLSGVRCGRGYRLDYFKYRLWLCN